MSMHDRRVGTQVDTLQYSDVSSVIGDHDDDFDDAASEITEASTFRVMHVLLIPLIIYKYIY